jgi:hypothetical protein
VGSQSGACVRRLYTIADKMNQSNRGMGYWAGIEMGEWEGTFGRVWSKLRINYAPGAPLGRLLGRVWRWSEVGALSVRSMTPNANLMPTTTAVEVD